MTIPGTNEPLFEEEDAAQNEQANTILNEGQEGQDLETNEQLEEAKDRYHPMSGQTKQRDYAGGGEQQTDASEEEFEESVPEPPIMQADKSDGGDSKEEEEEEKISPSEKRKRATFLADMILDGYARGWGFIGFVAKVSAEEINEKVINDEINLEFLIPIDEAGNELSLREFYKDYNDNIEKVTVVTEEFNVKVRDSMIAEFIKKGWGMTDTHNLYYHFGIDIVTRAAGIFTISKQMKSIQKQLMVLHKETRREEERVKKEAKKAERDAAVAVEKEQAEREEAEKTQAAEKEEKKRQAATNHEQPQQQNHSPASTSPSPPRHEEHENIPEYIPVVIQERTIDINEVGTELKEM